ncbi:MAG: YARHG domain-containing protein, partial [Myxococcota bacterium]
MCIRVAILVLALAPAMAGCDEKKSDPADPATTAENDKAELNKAEPNKAESDRAEPNKAEPNKAESDKATAGAAAKSALPLYYERKLKAEEITGRSLREIALMRNMIFARAGNTFRKTWLREHFESYPWYKPRPKIDTSKLTDIDWANAELIAQVERSLTPADLDKRKSELLAAIGTGAPTAEQRIELKLLSARQGSWIGVAGVPRDASTPIENPKALDQVLSWEDLVEMSRRDLRILRNMIYARHGRPFKSKVL